MFAERNVREREGWRGRKGEKDGQEGGKGGRRGAVGVWGGREAGGRRREGKEVAKETNQIIQKNKSIMLNDIG